MLVESPLKSVDDFKMLDLDRVNIQNDKIALQVLDAIRYIRDAIGNEVKCSVSLRAPISAASGLIDINQFLCILIRDPEAMDILFQFTLEAQFKIAKEFLKEGIPISISDPIGSCALINPRIYRTVALPYKQEFIRRCKKYMDKAPGLHICGNTTKILSDVKESGASSYSLDNAVDLKLAKEVLGDKMFLSGNVPPVEVMMQGTTAEVKEAVRRCYRAAWDSPKGFAICTGCDCCYGTPMENIEAYMEEARHCAKEQAEALQHPKEHYVWDE